jgi:translation initiation factor IF-1
MILTTGSDEARARAEASFKKEERAKEGAEAMMEYQANSRMVREKTERLRALRLAKEAADKNRGRGWSTASARALPKSKEYNVPKEELLQFEGLVTEILPDARYRVQLDNGHQLVAYTAGKMKKNRIKTLAGDRVTVEVSPYDLEKGRLIFRHKEERAAAISRPPQRNQFRRR